MFHDPDYLHQTGGRPPSCLLAGPQSPRLMEGAAAPREGARDPAGLEVEGIRAGGLYSNID